MIFKQCKTASPAVNLICMLLISMFLIIGTITESRAETAEDKTDDRAATVNGELITKSYLDQHVNMILKQFPGKEDGQAENDRIARIRSKILNDLINREVLFQESEKAGIKIDQALVDEQFMKMKKQYPDKGAFDKYMSSMSLTEDAVKSQIGKGLAIKKFVDTNIIEKIDVSEKELNDYYRNNKDRFTRPETVRASHILIKVEEDAINFEK